MKDDAEVTLIGYCPRCHIGRPLLKAPANWRCEGCRIDLRTTYHPHRDEIWTVRRIDAGGSSKRSSR